MSSFFFAVFFVIPTGLSSIKPLFLPTKFPNAFLVEIVSKKLKVTVFNSISDLWLQNVRNFYYGD